jgi:hypothetical protein
MFLLIKPYRNAIIYGLKRIFHFKLDNYAGQGRDQSTVMSVATMFDVNMQRRPSNIFDVKMQR